MKTSKKLLSLLLVAIMLVSAIPFQALAVSTGVQVTVVVDGETVPFKLDTSGTVTAADLIDFLELDATKDAALIAAINAVCPWNVATKGRVINLTTGSGNGGETGGDNGGDNGGETTTPAEKFDVAISLFRAATGDEYDFKFADKYSSITYAEILSKAGCGSNVTVTYNMGGVNDQTLAAGGTITVTAPCFVWIRPNAETEPDNGGNQGGSDVEQITPPAGGNQGGTTNTPTTYVLTVDLTDGNTEAGYIRTIPGTFVEGAKVLPRLNDMFKYMDRDGMTLKHWAFAATGTIITEDYTYNPADGTRINAVWNLQSFFLTLDENRQGEEYVNYGVRIKLGDDLWAAVNKWDKPTRKGYVFMGWSLNGKIIKPGDTYQYPDDATAYAVWELATASGRPIPPQKDGKVYLEIYLNGKYGELAKRVDITSYAADNKITRAEVETIVKKYYGPRSGYQLKFEGLFDEEGWYWYTRDPETNGEEYILVNGYDDAYVFVMVKNVKITYADPSNPKTGDYILTTALTLMAVSGLAAAAVYVSDKKRKV